MTVPAFPPFRALALPMLCCMALLVLSCSKAEEKKGGPAMRPVPVSAQQAGLKTLPEVIQAVGNVEPMATVAVKTQVGGQIMEQHVRDGQDVKAGDPLFLIDPRPFETAIREAQAKIDRDRALLDRASEDLKRYATLKQKDVVAQGQYDETYAAAKSLEGTIRLNEAALARARLDLEYAGIRAPISGRVGAITLTKGNVIKANDDRSLLVINQIEPVYVAFSVPEGRLPRIMERVATGEAPAVVARAGEGDEVLARGKLSSVDNAVDTKSGAIRLKGIFDNNDRRLWPGQFVRVELVLGQIAEAVVVPTKAVMDGLHGPYVYLIGPDGVVSAREIKPGPIVGQETVVASGLAAGEIVVTDGQLRLGPGMKAEIKGQDKAAPEAPK